MDGNVYTVTSYFIKLLESERFIPVKLEQVNTYIRNTNNKI